MKKIFQIGFNKCGSTSLHLFFTNNHIRSVHWDSGHLSRKIYENIALSQGVITGYENMQAFTDMVEENSLFEREAAVDLFVQLYSEFPDSIYIFNDRDLKKWIESRLRHDNGQYALRAKKRLGVASIDEVKAAWLKRYGEHKSRVLTFFSGNSNFVHFELDDPQAASKLIKTLDQNGFPISAKHFPHANKSCGNRLLV
jgi:hypothetical protein